LSIFLENHRLVLKKLFRDKNNILYIPVEYFCSATAAMYHHNQDTGMVIIKKEPNDVTIDLTFWRHPDRHILYNGTTVNIGLPIKQTQDSVLLPLTVMANLFKLTVSYIKDGRRIVLPPRSYKPVRVVRKTHQPPLKERREAASSPRAEARTVGTPANRPVAAKPADKSSTGVYTDKRHQPTRQRPPVPRQRPAIPFKPAYHLMKRAGFYVGLCHLRPEVSGLQLERTWSLFGSARVGVYRRLFLECRYDTYRSAQLTTFLGQLADVIIKTKGVTGYVVYYFPRHPEEDKWEFDVGVGTGIHKFDLFHNSITMNYHRWFRLDTYEIKLGAIYCFTDNWRMGMELRGIFGNERIALDGLGHTLNVDLDGFYAGVTQQFCF